MCARVAFVLSLLMLVVAGVVRAEETPLLATWPTVNQTNIVFSYGGYLRTVPRTGGEARQLTTGGHETTPLYSPDGKRLAFTGQYDGNADVYVMAAEGGEPKRLTWHPGNDTPVGWTPDGKKVLCTSARQSYADFERLYTISIDGGVPEVLPMWRGEAASFSPDGARIAYVADLRWQESWKRYRGGQTTPIYIVRLSDLQLEKVPRENSNDNDPVWIGDTIYFLSDRTGPVTLFAYDTKSKTVKQVLENNGFDLKSVNAGPDVLVYEQFGGIYLFDPKTGKSNHVNIQIAADLPATRAHWVKVGDKIQNAGISPTGARAVFEARGEILTVPGEKGDIRNLTRTPAVAERDPAWSPDGKSIAYFSDESGEYALHIADQAGSKAVKKFNLGNPPSYFYGPLWSPDSKKIAYTDKWLNLWYVDVEKGAPVKVTTDRYDDPTSGFSETWSPDSKWLTYAKLLANHLRAVFVYSVETGKESQITDGISDARYPVFDKGGKSQFFAVSTDVGLSAGWLDLSSFQHPVLRSVYAAVLKKGDPSPVEPQSDEEKAAEEKKDSASGDKGKEDDKNKEGEKGKESEKKVEPVKVTIDLDGIGQRIVSLPIKAANYVSLDVGKAGTLFLSEIVDVPRFEGATPVTVSKFDLTTRKTEAFVSGISGFAVSANGEKALYHL